MIITASEDFKGTSFTNTTFKVDLHTDSGLLEEVTVTSIDKTTGSITVSYKADTIGTYFFKVTSEDAVVT